MPPVRWSVPCLPSVGTSGRVGKYLVPSVWWWSALELHLRFSNCMLNCWSCRTPTALETCDYFWELCLVFVAAVFPFFCSNCCGAAFLVFWKRVMPCSTVQLSLLPSKPHLRWVDGRATPLLLLDYSVFCREQLDSLMLLHYKEENRLMIIHTRNSILV